MTNQPVSPFESVTWAGIGNAAFLGKCGNFLPGLAFAYQILERNATCLNDKLPHYLGFSTEEFQALEGFVGIAHEEDKDLVSRSLASASALEEGQTFVFTARFNHKDGSCKYLRSSCSRVDPASVFIFAQDVTDQVRFEDEASSSRQLFDETEKLLLFGSWSWSSGSDKLEWTDGMRQLLEYEELDPKVISNEFMLKHVLPEQVDHVQQKVNESINEKKNFELEFVIRTKTGKEKIVYTKGKPILDKEGNLRKFIGITRDVTSKKNLENERERNIRELNRSNKELEEFAYVASHDLHEPLRKVLTFAERLRTKFASSLGEDGTLYLNRISASADSMRNLIDNLLEFSRISRGSRSFVPCDLNDVLRGVVADQELRIEETSTSMLLRDLPTVEAVPAELKQLFNNLIGNALKFRRKDVQPVIEIEGEKLTHKEKADLLLPFNKVYYRIDIRDNGIGFEAVYAEKIFEIFQRLHGKAEYAGSGIGLAICKKIVENHDGVIFATGEPGTGSVFSVILPEKQQ